MTSEQFEKRATFMTAKMGAKLCRLHGQNFSDFVTDIRLAGWSDSGELVRTERLMAWLGY